MRRRAWTSIEETQNYVRTVMQLYRVMKPPKLSMAATVSVAASEFTTFKD